MVGTVAATATDHKSMKRIDNSKASGPDAWYHRSGSSQAASGSASARSGTIQNRSMTVTKSKKLVAKKVLPGPAHPRDMGTHKKLVKGITGRPSGRLNRPSGAPLMVPPRTSGGSISGNRVAGKQPDAYDGRKGTHTATKLPRIKGPSQSGNQAKSKMPRTRGDSGAQLSTAQKRLLRQ
jgi:hypothetical protein